MSWIYAFKEYALFCFSEINKVFVISAGKQNPGTYFSLIAVVCGAVLFEDTDTIFLNIFGKVGKGEKETTPEIMHLGLSVPAPPKSVFKAEYETK